MHKLALSGLVLCFCAVAAIFMLASDAPLVQIVLVVAGILVLLLGQNHVFERSRARRKLPQDFALTFADLRALERRDWLRLLANTCVGIALLLVGLVYGGRA